MNHLEADGFLSDAAERIGTPCFVYLTERLEERIRLLRTQFKDALELSFAVKSNPNPALLHWLAGHLGHLDISSVGEMRLALKAGWNPARLSFTGPGKREAELHEAIAGGVGLLVLESLREARLADRIARSLLLTQPVLVRIAPDRVPKGFGDQMAGRPSAFGIDIEDADEAIAEIRQLSGLRLAGFHIYSGTQCLKAEAVAENYRHYLAIFERLCTTHGIAPETLVLGAGLGVPYHDADAPFDLASLAGEVLPDLTAFKTKRLFRNTHLLLELGRYLVSESGYFLTRVVSVKQSRGSRIAICDGGMNNHLPASGHFGMVVRRNYSMHKVGAEGEQCEKVDIVGPLCTSIDRLAGGIELPRLEEGDLLAVHNSGAYGLTASPIHFISHAPPREVLVVEGELQDVSRNFADSGPVLVGRGHTTIIPTTVNSPLGPPRRGLLLEPAANAAAAPRGNLCDADTPNLRGREGFAV